ncbi:MAG: OmpA family protein [Sphingomonadales bacterium]|nr:OmpA family protein [Sphingomonadales bacterium]
MPFDPSPPSPARRAASFACAALAAGVLLAACDSAEPRGEEANAAANEAVVIADRPHDMAMTGRDDIAVYSPDDMRGYLEGEEAIGRRFELDRVTFASGSSSLDAAAKAQITDVANVLKDFPGAAITVSAFADPEGTVEANRKLSADRAIAVQQALAAAGIPESAVRMMIGGEIGTTVTRNKRRVEFMVERR